VARIALKVDVDTLRGLCKARGLRGYSDKKKADLIALLDGEAHAFENRSLIKTFVEILDRDDRSRIH
jgi:hypothetical protein